MSPEKILFAERKRLHSSVHPTGASAMYLNLQKTLPRGAFLSSFFHLSGQIETICQSVQMIFKIVVLPKLCSARLHIFVCDLLMEFTV